MVAKARGTAALLRSAPLFAALGDETRLVILAQLAAGGPASIATLTTGTQVTRQAVSKHLRILADAGLVRVARDGRQTRCSLRPKPLGEAHELLERLATQWAAACAQRKSVATE